MIHTFRKLKRQDSKQPHSSSATVGIKNSLNLVKHAGMRMSNLEEGLC